MDTPFFVLNSYHVGSVISSRSLSCIGIASLVVRCFCLESLLFALDFLHLDVFLSLQRSAQIDLFLPSMGVAWYDFLVLLLDTSLVGSPTFLQASARLAPSLLISGCAIIGSSLLMRAFVCSEPLLFMFRMTQTRLLSSIVNSACTRTPLSLRHLVYSKPSFSLVSISWLELGLSTLDSIYVATSLFMQSLANSGLATSTLDVAHASIFIFLQHYAYIGTLPLTIGMQCLGLFAPLLGHAQVGPPLTTRSMG